MASRGSNDLRLMKTGFFVYDAAELGEIFGTSIATRTIAKMINEWSQKLDNHTSFKQKMIGTATFYEQLIEIKFVIYKLRCLIILWSNDSFYSIFPSIS